MNRYMKSVCLVLLWGIVACESNPFLDEALYFYEQKNYNNAQRQLRKAVSAEPMRTDIRHKLALTYQHLNRENEAIAQYNAILKIDGNDKNARAYFKSFVDKKAKKAEKAFKEKSYQRAYELYNSLFDIDIGNKLIIQKVNDMGDIFLEEGDKYFKKEDFNRAVANYKTAFEIDPFNPSAKGNLEKLKKIYMEKAEKFEKTDTYEAIGDFENVIEIDPFNDNLYFKIGRLYSFFTEFKADSLWAYKSAISLNPSMSKYHAYLGELYFLNHEIGLAQKEYLFAFERVKEEIKKDAFRKKKYKYFYASLSPYKRVIQGFKEEAKDSSEKKQPKEIYFSFGKDKRVPIDFESQEIEGYFKASLDLAKSFSELFKLIKKSKIKVSEKGDIMKDLAKLLDLLREEQEDTAKEKEIFESLLNKFKPVDKADQELSKIGKIMGVT